MGTEKERWSSLAAGGFAGFVNTLFFYPLDVVKTRMQVNETTRVGLVTALRSGGMFRGLGASMVALVPNWALYWITYEELKRAAGTSSPLVHMGSAVGAGTVTAIATSPLWVIKTRMQLESMRKGGHLEYSTIVQSLTKIVGDEGILALYKGLVPTLVGLLHVAIQFPLYEALCTKLAEHSGPMNTIVIASSVSKVAASFAAYPHEVVRSRLQNNRSRVDRSYNEVHRALQMIRQIIRSEGVFAFYKGIGPNLVKTVPSTIITFSSYEYAKRALAKDAIVFRTPEEN